MDNLTKRYRESEIKRIIESKTPSDEQYKPKLLISHEGNKTKHIDISWHELELIKKVLIDDIQ